MRSRTGKLLSRPPRHGRLPGVGTCWTKKKAGPKTSLEKFLGEDA